MTITKVVLAVIGASRTVVARPARDVRASARPLAASTTSLCRVDTVSGVLGKVAPSRGPPRADATNTITILLLAVNGAAVTLGVRPARDVSASALRNRILAASTTGLCRVDTVSGVLGKGAERIIPPRASATMTITKVVLAVIGATRTVVARPARDVRASGKVGGQRCDLAGGVVRVGSDGGESCAKPLLVVLGNVGVAS